jgi:protein-disulfide isomerase
VIPGRIAIFVTVLVAGCRPAPPPPHAPASAEVAAVEAKIQNYFRRAVRVPDGVGMRLTDIALSPVPDLLTARLEISRSGQVQRLPIAFSRDGRFMIQGELNDLDADPDEVVMSRISLDAVPSRGAATAPVVIVEYLDLQCPFSAEVQRVIQSQLWNQYEGKVRLVVKHFPITALHPWATTAALAAECARQQSDELFWHVHDGVFDSQNDLTVANIKQSVAVLVRDAGGDVDTLLACLDAQATLDRINAEAAEASAVGVRSTPTLIINGRMLEGAVPIETIRAAVDEELVAPWRGRGTD